MDPTRKFIFTKCKVYITISETCMTLSEKLESEGADASVLLKFYCARVKSRLMAPRTPEKNVYRSRKARRGTV